MWKQQIALRNVLGDPWPSMSVEHGRDAFRNDIDDRIALVATLNEVNRLGRDPNRTAQQKKDVTDQAVRSAHISAELLSRGIISKDGKKSQNASPSSSPSAMAAANHRSWGPEWPGARSDDSQSRSANPPRGRTPSASPSRQADRAGGGDAEYMMNLTATERRLIERYRQQLQEGQPDSSSGGGGAPLPHEVRSRSLPRERPRGRYLKPVVEVAEECVSDGEDVSYVRGVQQAVNKGRFVSQSKTGKDGKTMLEGGSFIETFDPPSKGTGGGVTLPKGFGRVPSAGKKTKTLSSIPAMFAEADQTLTDPLPIHRGPIGVTHASLFGQIRHFRNPGCGVAEMPDSGNTEIRREPQREARSSDVSTPNMPV